MKFIFLTIFHNLMECYFKDSILKRAIENRLIEVEFINFRDFSKNKHKRIDTPLVGGGAGMIIDNKALKEALIDVKKRYANIRVIFLTPVAKKFTQKDAIRLAKEESIAFVCGRYEGFDESLIEEFADEVLSIGDYILTGGELAALIISDAISRNIEGVLGNMNSLKEESFEDNLLEAPNFSKTSNAPLILKSGNHKLINKWKKITAYFKTKFHRPDLLDDFKAF